MLKFSYVGCLRLFPVISAQFTLELCVRAWNGEFFFTKNPYFLWFKVVQGCRYHRRARQHCLL